MHKYVVSVLCKYDETLFFINDYIIYISDNFPVIHLIVSDCM